MKDMMPVIRSVVNLPDTEQPLTFELLKDIDTVDLSAKAGDIGLLDEITSTVWFDNKRYYYKLSTIQEHPEWFREIKSRERRKIEVKYLGVHFLIDEGNDFGWYELRLSEPVAQCKLLLIKQTIEQALNNVLDE